MATVMITKELLSDVRSRINSMSNEAARSGYQSKDPNKNAKLASALNYLAEDSWYAKHPDLRGVVPQDWLVEVVEIQHTITGLPQTGKQELGVTIISKGQWYAPLAANVNYKRCDTNVNVSQLSEEFQKEIIEFRNMRSAHIYKYKEVEKQVNSFLGSCSSLNAAVKKFPNITMYIPQGYIDRMNKKVVKGLSTAADNEGAAIDTALLSTVGAKHMLGS